MKRNTNAHIPTLPLPLDGDRAAAAPLTGDAEAYRAFCLGLGGVEEKMPFGRFSPALADVLALYVEGHIFTYADTRRFSLVNIKACPALADELRARYCAAGDPMNMSRRHWVGVRLGQDMDDATVRALLREAHRAVREQYAPRRGRRGAC